jgi:Spy/CpxP family protein refolding chaperone
MEVRYSSVRPFRLFIALIGCLAAIGVSANTARADDAPAATQPQTAAGAGAAQDPVVFLDRLQRRLDALDLTDAEKDRLRDALAADQQQAMALQGELQDAQPGMRMERIARFVRQVREQLVEILTPQQLLALRPAATSQPAGENPAAMPYLQKFRSAINQLDLSQSQKAQVADLFNQMAAKLQAIRRDPTLRGAGREAITNFRDQLLQILTPDQRQQLRELMLSSPASPASPAPASGAAAAENANKPAVMMTPENQDHSDNAAGAPTAAATDDNPAPTTAVAGSAAPPFRLLTPGNAEIKFDSFAGRVVVMEFGSISCPTFRDHIAAMAQLQDKYGARAYFLLVYTREQHPAGGWESARNQADGISVPQPPDMTARQKQAEKVRQALHITLPIGVDGMDDAVSKAYGGFPNATVVIGRDGRIAGRQQWTDPSGLPRLIEAALAAY